jgi:capsular polysaccharide biosynthesis protein
MNEAQIETLLETRGFEIIDVTQARVDDILYRCRDAAVVIGVEGSALMHGIFSMADHGTLICLQPPHRFNNVLKDHTDATGLKYGFVVGRGVDGEFEIAPDELLRTIELTQAGC